jgi:hypothetical protein
MVSTAGVLEKQLAIYTVIRGNLEEYDLASKHIILDRVHGMFTDTNITRLERGER